MHRVAISLSRFVRGINMNKMKESLITKDALLESLKAEMDYVLRFEDSGILDEVTKSNIDNSTIKEIYETIIDTNATLLGNVGMQAYEDALRIQQAEDAHRDSHIVKITAKDVLSGVDNWHNFYSWRHLVNDIFKCKDKLSKLYSIIGGDDAIEPYRYLFEEYPDLLNPYFVKFYYATLNNFKPYSEKEIESIRKISDKYEKYVGATNIDKFRNNIDTQIKKISSEAKEFEPKAIVSTKEWINILLTKKCESGNSGSPKVSAFIVAEIRKAIEKQKKMSNHEIKQKADMFAKSVASHLATLYKSGFDTFEQIGIVVPRDAPSGVMFISVRGGELKKYRSAYGESVGEPYTSPDDFDIIGGKYDKKKKHRIQAFLQDRLSSLSTNIAAMLLKTPEMKGKALENITYLDDYLPENFEELDTAYLARLHAEFQKADVRTAKGIISIRRWLTEGEKNGDEELIAIKKELIEDSKDAAVSKPKKLVKFTHVQRWYEWCLKNIYYKYLDNLEWNSKSTIAQRDALEQYTLKLKNALLKSIVLTSCAVDDGKKLLDSMELRISWQPAVHFLGESSNDEAWNPDKMIPRIQEKLFQFGDDEAKTYFKSTVGSVRAVKTDDSSGVKRCGIVDISYASGMIDTPLFAKDALESLRQSGKLPDWHNVILGLRQEPAHKNEVYAWKDFLNPSKNQPSYRAYTIFAGSRSGKGTMTSAIITAAIASGVKIFYIDGKPENGGIIGRIAWEKGKEAFVFDGQPKGAKDPFKGEFEKYTYKMENAPADNDNEYSHELYVRNPAGPSAYLEAVPPDLQDALGTHGIDRFLGLMRYFKAMNLFVDMVCDRAANGDEDNGVLWVFDEMTNMCEGVEAVVRKDFSNYVAKKEPKAKVLRKGNILYDFIIPYSGNNPGVQYINDWCSWVDSIRTKLSKAITISFGASNTDLIMIFQNAAWLAKYRDSCLIAQFVTTFEKCTKIVGKGGLAQKCGEFGNATSVNANWYSQELEPKKLWAITDGGMTSLNDLDGNLDQMENKLVIIKPFNIFTIPNKGKDAERAKIDQDFARRYFKGYIEALEEAQTEAGIPFIPTEEKLQGAWDYATDLINRKGWLLPPEKTAEDSQVVNKIKSNVNTYLYNDTVLQYMYNISSETFKSNYSFSLTEYRHSIMLNEDGKPVAIDKEIIQTQEQSFKIEAEKIKEQIKNLYERIKAFSKETFDEDKFTLLKNEIESLYKKIGSKDNLLLEDGKERTLHGLILEEYRGVPLYVEVDSKNSQEDIKLNLEIQKDYYHVIYGEAIPKEELADPEYNQSELAKATYIEGAKSGLFGALETLSYLLENIGYKAALLSNNGNLETFRLDGTAVTGFQRITDSVPKVDDNNRPYSVQELINKFTLPQLIKDENLFKLIEEDYRTLQYNYVRICNQLYEYVLTDTFAEYLEDMQIFSTALAQVFKGKNKLDTTKLNKLADILKGVQNLEKAVGTFNSNSLETLIGCNALVSDVLMNFNAVEHLADIIPQLMTGTEQEKSQGRNLWHKLRNLASNKIVSDLESLNSTKIDLTVVPNGIPNELSLQEIEKNIENTKNEFMQAKDVILAFVRKM